MPNALIATCLVIMWVVVFSRMFGARRSPDRAMIALALASGICSITIGQTSVGPWLGTVTGSRALPFVAESGLAVIAVTWVISWVLHAWREQGGPVWWARTGYPWCASVLVIAVLAVVGFRFDLDWTSTYAAMGQQRASWPQLTYLAVYECWMMVVFTFESILFARLMYTAGSKWVRLSLILLSAASIGSMARGLYTMAYLLPQVIGTPVPGVPWSAAISKHVNIPSYTVGFIGISLPAIERAQQWARTRWALRNITPLWDDLTRSFPGLVRLRSTDTPDAELQARDMVVLEALLWLREYSSPEALDQARAWAQGAGTPPQRLDAAAIARWVHATLPIRNPAPRRPVARWPLSPHAGDPAWLLDVAYEYNRLRRRAHLPEVAPSWQQDSTDTTAHCRPRG